MAFSTELCIPDAEKPGGQSMNMTQKFTEAKPQQAIIGLLERQDYPYTRGTALERSPCDALILSDLREFLASRYAADQITDGEIDSVTRQSDALNAAGKLGFVIKEFNV